MSWRERCTCPREIQNYGRLYGISMGRGPVRLDTNPDCPEHGDDTIRANLRSRRETQMQVRPELCDLPEGD